ncbi:hypothetical protein BN871_CL_00570 [Paenibacillus sp. P22]|nr:hypothetical protein BN871_CL_00570 [Paenibacillus sp. P22]
MGAGTGTILLDDRVERHDPYGAGNDRDDDDKAEHQRHDVVPRLLAFVDMHEEEKLDEKLQNRCDENDEQRPRPGHQAVEYDEHRDDSQYDRDDESDRIRLERPVVMLLVMAMSVAVGIGMRAHLHHPHEVNDGEQEDPDHVEKMPVQAEVRNLALRYRCNSVLAQLEDQPDAPEDADGNVDSVGADQGEERRQECARADVRSFMDEVHELRDLEVKERRSEQERHDQPENHAAQLFGLHLENGQAAREAGRKQEERRGDESRNLEQLLARRSAVRMADQDDIGREQGAEQQSIGYQEQPEARCLERLLFLGMMLVDLRRDDMLLH